MVLVFELRPHPGVPFPPQGPIFGVQGRHQRRRWPTIASPQARQPPSRIEDQQPHARSRAATNTLGLSSVFRLVRGTHQWTRGLRRGSLAQRSPRRQVAAHRQIMGAGGPLSRNGATPGSNPMVTRPRLQVGIELGDVPVPGAQPALGGAAQQPIGGGDDLYMLVIAPAHLLPHAARPPCGDD